MFTCGTPVVYDGSTAKGVAVAQLNVCVLQVSLVYVVSFSHSAAPPDWCPMSLHLRGSCSVWDGGLSCVLSRCAIVLSWWCEAKVDVKCRRSFSQGVSNTCTTLASRATQLPRLAW